MNVDDLTPYAQQMPFMAKPGGTARLLRYLPSFLRLAEEESFAVAATKLNLSQPALSRRIKNLEEELGFELFERLPRGVRVSAAGKSLFMDCRQMLEMMEKACRRAAHASRHSAGLLRVGLTDIAIRAPLVTEALRRFQAEHEDVEILHICLPTESQLIALSAQDIDVGFVHFPVDHDPPISFGRILLDRDDFVVAMPEGHRLASVPNLKLADLQDEAFIWPTRFSGKNYGDRIMSACEAVPFSPRISAYATNVDQFIGFVLNGTGIAFLPASTRNLPGIHGLLLRRVKDLSVEFTLEMTWREDKGTPYARDLGRIAAHLASDPQVPAFACAINAA